MEKMTIKEFKDQSNIEIIQELMKVNNGYITSKQLTELGIHRMYLNIMVDRGIIEKLDNGIYLDVNKFPDSYYVLNLNLSGIIYSHMTALYFHGLSIKVPDTNDDIYELGLTEVKTPFGNIVRVYDIERCICDIIRSKKRMDNEHIKYSLREYIKRKDKDLVKLSKYADKMGIKKEVMDLLEWLYE